MIKNYRAIFEYNDWTCCICGSSAHQLAHGIANTVANRKQFGEEVVDHENNLFPVCGLYCNSKCNVGMNPAKTQIILDMVASGKALPAMVRRMKLEGK